jgi:epoxyqueuosine reductase QueG
MEDLSRTAKDLVLNYGATAVGIATIETLAGGPPSTELSRVLPEAKAAVCFALSLDQRLITPFLAKKDYLSHNRNNTRTNLLANGFALELASFLTMKGYGSVPVAANNVYRKDTPRGPFDEMPEISHRYLAVRSGVGHFGLSGNVIRPEQGAGIILASVVTTAELIPTHPLPEQDNYCDDCRLCMASCASGLMSSDEMTTVTLGGIDFSYASRRGYIRCDYVCGGYAGLHGSGKWSTWSPARFPIPEMEQDFRKAFKPALAAYSKRPKPQVSFFHPLMPNHQGEYTCGHCQLVCHPDKEERKRRHKALMESGVVIQDPDGSYRATTPEAAKEHMASMDSLQRALYEPVND